jgi:hypothetical protein
MKDAGWTLDYKRFRVWLTEKYAVKQAYLFMGLIPKYKDLYTYLSECGFTLVFKDVVYDGGGKPKGNCDAELVLKATRDAYEGAMERGILVSSDGDYAGLVRFLMERNQFEAISSSSSSTRSLARCFSARIPSIGERSRYLGTSQWKSVARSLRACQRALSPGMASSASMICS